MWDQTRHALTFFQQHLPFQDMRHRDELTTADDDYVLAQAGRVYAVYLPDGGSVELDLGEASAGTSFDVWWYDPRNGGDLQPGAVTRVTGGGPADLGQPPADPQADWVVLVESDGDPVEGPQVTGVTLIDADRDQPIAAFDPMQDGQVINLALLPTDQLNIRADTDPAQVGSVRFSLDGAVSTENVAPYALRGDTDGDYNGWTPALGAHRLEVTAYTQPNAGGLAGQALVLDFEVVDDPEQPDGGDGGADPGAAGDGNGKTTGDCGCAAAGGGPGLILLTLALLRRRPRG
jgi:hypothetical protein